MAGKKKEKVARPSVGPESKSKPPIRSLFRNLFSKPAKQSTKRPSDASMHLHRSASAGASQSNSGNLVLEDPIHRSPSTPPVSGIASSDAVSSQSLTVLSTFSPNQPLHAVPSSSIEFLPIDKGPPLHQSSSAGPAMVPSLAVSHVNSAHQSSTSVSTLDPTLLAEVGSTDYSSISAPDLRASIQQSISPTSNEKEFHRISSQPNPAVARTDHTNSGQSMFAKGCIASLRILGTIVGVPTESMENEISGDGTMADHCSVLVKSVKNLMEFNVSPAVRGSLENLHGKLAQMATEDNRNVEDARWKVTNYLQVFLLENIVTGGISSDAFGKMKKQLSDILDKVAGVSLLLDKVADPPPVTSLPSASAAYDDYTETQKRQPCFAGTRQALLKEVITWLTDPNSNIYVLFGLAGIGKSTIAQTVATEAHKTDLLGASFFFSRDKEERRSAKLFFTSIASQLCVYDPDFAKAIGSVLSTEKGKSAITKQPLEQLETLILEPLRKLTPRKVVVVVIDALDECNDDDGPAVLMGLDKFVQSLPSFKVVLTTRPQPHLQFLLDGKTSKKVFHLHNIEDSIVDRDIELYLKHNLAWEQVRIRLPTLTKPWAASDEDIQSLVRAAGRLFIIASTTVRFILDKTSTPKLRMEKLQMALDQDHTPFKTLNDFYTTILRSAVPEGCELDTAHLYQTVIGSIIVIQQPLSIHALATLVNVDVDNITAVLGNLQSVILLGSSDIPLVYHKSFPDFIQDPARCKEEDLLINPRLHHTQMAIRCLRLLNRRLKQNILELGDPARFMNNAAALKIQDFAENHIHKQIPSELQYTCLYFANHLESADVMDIELTEELERFLNSRLLNWLEALSWIGKLDSAHHALLTLQELLKQGSSDLGQIVFDGWRFIGKFYDLIRQFALHTYHSALPFTPTETSLYKKYNKQMSFCQVLGGQKVWDGLITTQKAGARMVGHIIFSPNNTLFACRTDEIYPYGSITIHDATLGIPLRRINGRVLTIASDFSKVAAFNPDGLITLFSVKGVTPFATIKPSATVTRLALSSDGFRLLAGLRDGTVGLWDTQKCEQISSIDGWMKDTGITFSSDGNRAAFVSRGIVKLLDGMEGKIVADLAFPGIKWPILKFWGDSSRLACLALNSLRIWNSRDGALIGTAEDVGDKIAISTDRSLVVTGEGDGQQLKLWSGKNLALLETLDLDFCITALAIQTHLIGIVSYLDRLVVLYDINSHAFVARLPFYHPAALAFSPDCTRLAAGSYVQLWDVPSITANTASHEKLSKPTALAFTLDCSRLASGHEDGTVKLWDTSNMNQLIDHQCHSTRVAALAFNANGGGFASVSKDEVIKLWNGEDGEPRGVLQSSGQVTALALSSSILAAATPGITLWDLDSHSIIATFDQCYAELLAFSNDLPLLAMISRNGLMLWNTVERKLCTTFNIADDSDSEAWSIRFLPGDSQLAVQLANTDFYSLNHFSGFKVSENQTIDVHYPSWQGISVLGTGKGVIGRLRQSKGDVSMLHIPNDIRVTTFATGSSKIALGCEDGRILLVKSI